MKINLELYIEALIRERDEFLEQYPELKSYQDEIEKTLIGIDSPLERASLLNKLLIKKLQEELLVANAKLRQIDSLVRAEENKNKKKRPA